MPGVVAPASSATSSRPPISLARTGAMVRSPACAGAGRRPRRGLVGESMTTGNRPIRASCALAALIFATLPVAGCGGGGSHHTARGSSEPASQLVSRALGGGAAVRSGQVRLSLSLLAPGARQAFTLRSATRFSVASTGATPSLALTLATLSRAGSGPAQQMRAALVSGPRGVSLTRPGPPRARRLAGRAGPAGRLRAAAGRRGGAARARRLGVAVPAPLRLAGHGFRSPRGPRQRRGSRWVPSLAEVARLAALSAALQQAGGQGSAAAVARALATDATQESGGGTVQLYADPASQLPRSLTVSATLRPRPGPAGASAPPPLSISLRMGFSDLGEADRAGTS